MTVRVNAEVRVDSEASEGHGGEQPGDVIRGEGGNGVVTLLAHGGDAVDVQPYGGSSEMSVVAPHLVGSRKGLFAAFRVLTVLFTADVVVQFFLAGAGAFGTFHEKTDDAFGLHAANGHVLSIASLVMLVVVGIARPGRRLVRATTWLFAAMVVQNLLAGLGQDQRWLGALHPVNGLVIAGLSGWIVLVCFDRLRPRGVPATNSVHVQARAEEPVTEAAVAPR